ncbi:hypothetical protein [Rhizobium leguminosarum]
MNKLSGMLSAVFIATTVSVSGASAADGGFSKFVLEAVDSSYRDWGGLGYGNSALTHELQFGDNGTLRASDAAPLTMCVAAQLEILVQALNAYSAETGDLTPFHFIPRKFWERTRPLELRGMMWQVANSPARGHGGATYAFENFGMGHALAFKDMFPGTFITFNRARSGHAGIFLAYLDAAGNELDAYSDEVAGFKYFSSQGKGKPRPISGLGYRYGFFGENCPALPQGHLRDCGILRSENNGILTGAYVMLPPDWDTAKANAAVIGNNDATDPTLIREGVFDANYFTGETTD